MTFLFLFSKSGIKTRFCNYQYALDLEIYLQFWENFVATVWKK